MKKFFLTGYTVLYVLVWVLIARHAIPKICTSNIWYTHVGVLHEIRKMQPNVDTIKIEDGIETPSKVIVLTTQDKVYEYNLYTNIKFEYRLEKIH